MKTISLAVVAVVVTAGVGCKAEPAPPAAAPGVVFPDRPFARPAGPHPVGTSEFTWTDSTRQEPYTRATDDRRRIVVQVWYPTTAAAGADTARYLARPAEFSDTAGGNAARNVLTNAIQDGPVAGQGSGGWPVLLYNHGGGWTRWSATFTTEWLASHGFVVFSVEHFGFNQSRLYPDGTAFAADTLTFPVPTGELEHDATTGLAYLDEHVFGIWRDDARFALDRIERLAREAGPFQDKLDLSRVGALGWSFGGALAVELSAVDTRVRAAVDHDGQLFGAVRERGTTRPVLLFHHGDDDALGVPEEQRPFFRELMARVARTDTVTRARSSGPWYTITIPATSHGDFSDLSLFYPRADSAADPREVHATINAYTLAFFEQYLNGKPAALFAAASDSSARAVFRRWE